MALSPTDLRARINASSDTFTLSGAEFGTEPGKALFGKHLPDATLSVKNVRNKDAGGLALAGDVRVLNASEDLPARVVFQEDSAGTSVAGVRIDVTLRGWTIPTGQVEVDPGALKALGEAGVLHLVLGVVVPRYGEPVATAGVGLDVPFPSAGAQARPYVWGMRPETGFLPWVLQGPFPPVPVGTLDDLKGLAKWSGGQVGPFGLPSEITPKTLSLTDLAVSFTASEIRSVTPRVALGASWDIVAGALKVSDLYAEFEILRGVSAPAVRVGGRITVAKELVVDVAASLPDGRFLGIATPAGEMKLAPLLDTYFPDSKLPGLSGLGLKRLTLMADPWGASPSYTLGLEITGDSQAGPVTMTDLFLRVGRTSAGVTGELGCTWRVGDGAMNLVARRSGTGWAFSGVAYDLSPRDVFRAFDLDAPPVLKDLEVESIAATFTSDDSKKFELEAHAAFPLGEVSADLQLKAALSRKPPGWDQTYSGTLALAVPTAGTTPRQLVLTLSGNIAEGEFTASVADPRGVSLKDLATLLGVADETVTGLLDQAGAIEKVSIGYATADRTLVFSARQKAGGALTVVSTRPPGKDRSWVARVTAALSLGLSGIPLLEGQIPAGQDAGLRGMSVLVSSGSLTARQTAHLNRALTGCDPQLGLLPAAGLAKGVSYAVDLLLPGTGVTSVLVKPDKKAPKALGPADDAGADTGAAAREAPPTARVVLGRSEPAAPFVTFGGETPPTAPTVAWVNVERAVGPLYVRRVGVSLAGGSAWAMFEATLGMAGLTVGVLGLGIGVPLKDPSHPVFRLDGLGVGYDRAPVTILGALANRQKSGYDVFVEGVLAVSVKEFGLTALGAYLRRTNGEPSMFVFGRASGRFGGPPPVQVTGIMAGFGYHTTVRVPDGDKVLDFPFLRKLNSSGGEQPLDVLTELMSGGKDAWVRPSVGQIWFAAGAAFRVFEFLDCQALLLLELGDDFAVAVLGTADARFPKTGRQYARALLGLSATYRASEGVLKLTAQLAAGSYLIDESCVLTGGFALYVWLDGARSGDFVLTLGGYHPGFPVPAHYPRVPALGFSWAVSGQLSIRGSAFFALTPGAIMAGGELRVDFHSGDLHAWLSAWAKLLIEWAPFSFDLDIGVEIGVSYVLNLWLVRVPIRVEIGASLRLWGPPTTGEVTVKLWFIKFTVDFGPGSDAVDKPARWKEVQPQLPPSDGAVRLAPTDGLIPAQVEDDRGREKWIVGPGALSFAVRTAVPLSELRLEGPDKASGKTLKGTAVNLRPCRDAGRNLASVLVLTLTDVASGKQRRLADWEPTRGGEVTSSLPAALWGPYTGRLGPTSPSSVPNQLTGVDLRIPMPERGYSPGAVPAGTLGCDDRAPDGVLPFAKAVSRDLVATGDEPDRVDVEPASDWNRSRLFDAMEYLGVSPGTNDAPLRPDDVVVAGDTLAGGISVSRRVALRPGPRIYALDSEGGVTTVETDSLAVSDRVRPAHEVRLRLLAASGEGDVLCGVGQERMEIWDITTDPLDGAERQEHDMHTQSEPRGVAILAGGKRACVTGVSETWLIDLDERTREKSFGFHGVVPGEVATAEGSLWGGKAYVFALLPNTDQGVTHAKGTVAVTDVTSTAEGDPPFFERLAGPDPSHIAVDPKGRRLYVVNDRHATVSVVDAPLTDDGEKPPAAVLPTGTDPGALAVSPDGTRLYVANRVAGTVSVFDTSDASAAKISEVGQPVWVGSHPVALAVGVDGKRLFAALADPVDAKGVLAVLDLSGAAPVLLPARVTLPAPALVLAATAPPHASTT
ncbi:DUF6603 domain-containing protein [Streptomyces hainanensis]|uniref:DUF6603 domain-containing protein n=1 Tax=Streptomyces hainanensis TaxID=402648 RepID=A0A4R4TKA9_9ACTN|nr:DUF6603 domain-containing protein [Streptomyces hainanensis]TDC78368.1 hypothetical protein E1283_05210 [Streptomyces hainanensis]